MTTKPDSPRITLASHLITAALILAVLVLKLLPAAITGFLVYSLTVMGANFIVRRTKMQHARHLALVLGVIVVIVAFTALGLMTAHFVHGAEGVSWVMLKLAAVLDAQRTNLPAFLQTHLPASVDELQTVLVNELKTHGEQLSAVGVDTLKTAAHILLGLVIGAFAACATFARPEAYQPLAGALLRRMTHLRDAFDKVVFAQVQISAINTALTALYLCVGLPLFGSHLPLSKTLVFITFVCGLIPVAGNLLSNGVILLISLGVSFKVALASLIFLLCVHKLEYFINARVVGNKIHAAGWELIMAMLGMEALFGMPGLVVAPILYAYVKHELAAAGLIGRMAVEEK